MDSVLIVDDDKTMVDLFTAVVERLGHKSRFAHSLADAERLLRKERFDAVLLDVMLPDGNGIDFLPTVKASADDPEVIIVTGMGDPEGAELAIQSGAWDYIQKQSSISDISLTIQRALQYRSEKKSQKAFLLNRENLVGESPALKACLEQLIVAAAGEVNVLITGETGSGKEVFAHTIHANSGRKAGNFVVVDCASLPENLAESILFGHAKGAFTGADRSSVGLVTQADGGTLFLDEVGELPLSLQKTFLRVLEHGYRPVGAGAEIRSNFRLLSATNRDLDVMVEKGEFRGDLLFRLRSLNITLPPLRERNGDVKLLTMNRLAMLSEKANQSVKGVSPEFLEYLELYPWPGNVRELFHTLENAVASAGFESTLFPKHLPKKLRAHVAKRKIAESGFAAESSRPGDAAESPALFPSSAEYIFNDTAAHAASSAPLASQRLPAEDMESTSELPSLKSYRREMDRRYLLKLINASRGSIKTAVRLSGISRSRLYALLGEHNLSLKP